jgi:hypothetical protein
MDVYLNVQAAGHRLVVRPDAFNVAVLFKTTLTFLDKVKSVVPPRCVLENATR